MTFISSESATNTKSIYNPFDFHHYNVSNIQVSSDSHHNLRPIKMNFDADEYLEGYLSLIQSSNINNLDSGNFIKRDEYSNGYFIVGIDLTEDLEASADHLNLLRTGSLRIDLQFSKILKESICVLIYAEFQNEICVDKHKNILLDYSS